uniref:Uncharacterized protein n=1 Tax=Octopus bimaculoides TaxID=37653 RepID=A0A0L8HEE0_OCTBM
MLAAAKGNKEVIKILLENGANPALVNKDGWNSFHIAVREGKLDIVEILLNNNPSIWKVSSKNQRTPLHTAALHGCQEVTQWLLSDCCHPVDVRDACGTTPLMDAIRNGHTEVAEMMIKEFQILCPRFNGQAEHFDDAFKRALRKSNKEGMDEVTLQQFLRVYCVAPNPNILAELKILVKVFMKRLALVIIGCTEEAQMCANPKQVYPDNLYLMKYIIERAMTKASISRTLADINQHDTLGYQLLHIAAHSGKLQSVAYLLNELHVDPMPTSHKKVTPLHLAAKEGHLEVIKYLIAHGADRNTTDDMGRKPLDMVSVNHKCCMDILQNRTADAAENSNSLG